MASSIIIVGCGPRGLAVLEQLALQLRASQRRPDLDVHVVEPYRPGAGRIWRTDQPAELIMNTVAQELTMFSGPPSGPDRPGAGRTFDEWWAEQDVADFPGPNSIAPRRLYGQYLEHCFSVIGEHLGALARLHVHPRWVTDVRALGDATWTVHLDSGEQLHADVVILATGHPRVKATAELSHGQRHKGDSAAELPLSGMPADAQVGVVGLGLGFIDILARLTTGRGGRFEWRDGVCEYLPSGQEPSIHAFSRSGTPILARGINQKPVPRAVDARIFTRDRDQPLADVEQRVWNPLVAEVNRVYLETLLLRTTGRSFDLVRRLAGRDEDINAPTLASEASRIAGMDIAPLDLKALARPFAGHVFRTTAEWRDSLSKHIEDDVRLALLGNVHEPIKAATDVIRDVREELRRRIVTLSASQRRRFDAEHAPVISLVSTGPPAYRIIELLAMMRAGVLDVLPPGGSFEHVGDGFLLSSTSSLAGPTFVNYLVDSRLPRNTLEVDGDLARSLVDRGIATPATLTDGSATYPVGGIAVTVEESRVLDGNGQAHPGLYAIGLPTEGVRWFTQAAGSMPGSQGSSALQIQVLVAKILESIEGKVG